MGRRATRCRHHADGLELTEVEPFPGLRLFSDCIQGVLLDPLAVVTTRNITRLLPASALTPELSVLGAVENEQMRSCRR